MKVATFSNRDQPGVCPFHPREIVVTLESSWNILPVMTWNKFTTPMKVLCRLQTIVLLQEHCEHYWAHLEREPCPHHSGPSHSESTARPELWLRQQAFSSSREAVFYESQRVHGGNYRHPFLEDGWDLSISTQNGSIPSFWRLAGILSEQITI